MTPPSHDRSIVESALIEALEVYLEGTRNERDLARLAIDLIKLAGDDPKVVGYINRMASLALELEEQRVSRHH